jgi:hypothetical protein
MTVASFIVAERTDHRVPHVVSCRVLGVSQSCGNHSLSAVG